MLYRYQSMIESNRLPAAGQRDQLLDEITMAHIAGEKMKQSVSGIEQTSQLMRYICAYSEEQSSVISQINITVTRWIR